MAEMTHDEMAALWTALRAEVDAAPGGLAENVRYGGCGDNYDAVSTRSGGRARFCDLWSFANEDGTEWDHGKLAANPAVRPPAGLTWDALRDMGWIKGAHVWATTGGRHYDIEAPDGVDNPFDLNDIRRGMVETLSVRDPGRLAELSSHHWWRESLALRETIEAMIAGLETGGPVP